MKPDPVITQLAFLALGHAIVLGCFILWASFVIADAIRGKRP